MVIWSYGLCVCLSCLFRPFTFLTTPSLVHQSPLTQSSSIEHQKVFVINIFLPLVLSLSHGMFPLKKQSCLAAVEEWVQVAYPFIISTSLIMHPPMPQLRQQLLMCLHNSPLYLSATISTFILLIRQISYISDRCIPFIT